LLLLLVLLLLVPAAMLIVHSTRNRLVRRSSNRCGNRHDRPGWPPAG
jgi:hypothetical protein